MGTSLEGVGDFQEQTQVRIRYSVFASVITIKVSQASMLRGRVQGEELRAVDKGRVRDYWRELDPFKSTGLGMMLLKESGDNWLMSLQDHSIIFENQWTSGEIPDNWRWANITVIFKKGQKKGPSGSVSLSQSGKSLNKFS